MSGRTDYLTSCSIAELKLRTEDLQVTLDTVTSATEAVEGELDVTK